MSKTLEPYKWYWGYTSPKGITYVFNTYDEAFNHASDKGMFDEIWKHQFEDLKQNSFLKLGKMNQKNTLRLNS